MGSSNIIEMIKYVPKHNLINLDFRVLISVSSHLVFLFECIANGTASKEPRATSTPIPENKSEKEVNALTPGTAAMLKPGQKVCRT